MTSETHGQDTSAVEVVNINGHGIWLNVWGREYYLPYQEYPWFENATIRQVLHVQLLHDHHLCWPDLDVDLEMGCLENPARYPLKFQ